MESVRNQSLNSEKTLQNIEGLLEQIHDQQEQIKHIKQELYSKNKEYEELITSRNQKKADQLLQQIDE